jgi:hypothetical protein
LIAWHDPDFQQAIVERIRARARAGGREFETGVTGFGWLAETEDQSPPVAAQEERSTFRRGNSGAAL